MIDLEITTVLNNIILTVANIYKDIYSFLIIYYWYCYSHAPQHNYFIYVFIVYIYKYIKYYIIYKVLIPRHFPIPLPRP